MTIKDIFNFIAKQTKPDMLKCGEYYPPAIKPTSGGRKADRINKNHQ